MTKTSVRIYHIVDNWYLQQKLNIFAHIVGSGIFYFRLEHLYKVVLSKCLSRIEHVTESGVIEFIEIQSYNGFHAKMHRPTSRHSCPQSTEMS